MIAKDKWGIDVDVSAIFCADAWVAVLAAPHLYRGLTRPAEPDVIVKLLDVWIARADRRDLESDKQFGYHFDGEAARRLRAMVAAWTPPELPAEVTEAARALVRATGFEKSQRRVDDYIARCRKAA